MPSPKSRRLWIGTSWKMNKTLAEADRFVDKLLTFRSQRGPSVRAAGAHGVGRVRDRLPPDSPLLLGAQNAHWAGEGSWTGEISMRMAKDAGATLIEIGHSERREHFGETDRTVALKAAAAVAHGPCPIDLRRRAVGRS
jgi:triosephosphate isomerase